MNKRNGQSGFTLVEILVASLVLILVVGAATQMYVTASSAQRRAHGKQNALDSSRYALEFMARSIRQSRIPSNAFAVSGQIYMVHNDDVKCRIGGLSGAPCWVYYRRTVNNGMGRIQEAIVSENTIPANNCSCWQNVAGFVSAAGDTANVNVTSLTFTGTGQNDNGIHPKVTISMSIRPELDRSNEESPVRIQTTITSRDPRWSESQN